jgi:hypothetical protein
MTNKSLIAFSLCEASLLAVIGEVQARFFPGLFPGCFCRGRRPLREKTRMR